MKEILPTKMLLCLLGSINTNQSLSYLNCESITNWLHGLVQYKLVNCILQYTNDFLYYMFGGYASEL